MEGSEGVLCAIQSLAGIYVYDYQPMEEISRRINHRFALAEARLSHLLSRADLSVDEASELITIASILSMQDVSGLFSRILDTTSRTLAKPLTRPCL
jgi:hypothetical protein